MLCTGVCKYITNDRLYLVIRHGARNNTSMLLQLLLLAAAWPRVLQAGAFDSYIINPASYQDVINPKSARWPGQTQTVGTDKPCCDVSLGETDAGAVTGHARLLQQQQQQEGPSSDPIAGSSWQTAPSYSRSLQQAAGNPLRLQPPYNVCVASWAPMVRCTPGDDQDAYKGYMIELFRMAAKEVGWADEDYAFNCMDYSSMMADLNDPAGNCSLSAAGVEVFPAYIAEGLKFSWPTYKSGLRVMIAAHLQSGSTWAFSEIFKWEVWLMLGVTGIVVGILVALLEWAHGAELKAPAGAKGKHWQSWQWYSLAKMFHVVPHVGDPYADASRVLVLGYGFLVLVMVSMYTAVAASRITAAALVHPVHSQEDLKGQSHPYKTLSWNQYVPALKDHQHIYADGKPWERDGDLHNMLDSLRDGSHTALILDAPVLEYTVGTNEECDLFLVGEVFESFSLALAFPPAFSDALVFDFSRSIVRLQTYQGALDMLENVYIKTGGTSKCFGTDAGGHGSGETIELRQVSGLWYILLITVGICFFATLAHNVRKDPRKMATFHRFSSFVGATGPETDAAAHTAVEPFDSAVGRTAASPPPAAQGRSSAADTQGVLRCAADGAGRSRHLPLDSACESSAAGRTTGSADGKGGQELSGYHSSSGGATKAQHPQPQTRQPSALQVFLGTSASFGARDDEAESPTSPQKKMPLPLR